VPDRPHPALRDLHQDGGHGLGTVLAHRHSPRVIASYKLSFGASFIAAAINAVAGLLIAWVLVRYRFPGKRFIDSLVDLPFALPTAVAGIALTALYAPTGWIGKYFAEYGIKTAFSPDRCRDRADLHRIAVRRPHGAAGAGGSR
jgi:ABC-type sulfate transport system permease component